LSGAEGSADGVAGGGIEVGLVTSVGVPGAGVIVSPARVLVLINNEHGRYGLHKIPEVEVPVHGGELELLVVGWACIR